MKSESATTKFYSNRRNHIMKKSVKKIATISSLLLAGMYSYNKYIDTAISPMTSSKNDHSYTWKDIKINYSIKGDQKNPPLLLIHNLYPTASKEEWYRIDETLSQKYCVYEADLPGCGKSDKSVETYINYMYVQFLQDFINSIVGRKVNVCASALSSSFTLMAARINPDLFDKIIIINPTSVDDLVKPVTKECKVRKKIYELPIIGTFVYNCKMNKAAILDDYKYIYFYNDKNVPEKAVDIAYYNSHYDHGNGKNLYASILGNYTSINIIHALSKIQNEIYLIGGSNKKAIQEYKQYNDAIHISSVSNCRLLPHLEIPQTIIEKIEQIIPSN